MKDSWNWNCRWKPFRSLIASANNGKLNLSTRLSSLHWLVHLISTLVTLYTHPTILSHVNMTVRYSVCLSVRSFPFVRPFVRPSVHPFLHMSVRPSFRPSVPPSVRFRSSVRSSVRPSVRPSIRSSVGLCDRPYVRSFVRPSVPPSIRPSICLAIHPSLRPSVHLSFRS